MPNAEPIPIFLLGNKIDKLESLEAAEEAKEHLNTLASTAGIDRVVLTSVKDNAYIDKAVNEMLEFLQKESKLIIEESLS